MPEDEMHFPVWSGVVKIGTLDLKCHVLDDGRRIIEAESVHEFMRRMADGTLILGPDDAREFAEWQRK